MEARHAPCPSMVLGEEARMGAGREALAKDVLDNGRAGACAALSESLVHRPCAGQALSHPWLRLSALVQLLQVLLSRMSWLLSP